MGKKESTDRRLNQACRLSVTPSSLSSLECRRSDARTATNGYVRTCSLNKSAKVVLINCYRIAIGLLIHRYLTRTRCNWCLQRVTRNGSRVAKRTHRALQYHFRASRWTNEPDRGLRCVLPI